MDFALPVNMLVAYNLSASLNTCEGRAFLTSLNTCWKVSVRVKNSSSTATSTFAGCLVIDFKLADVEVDFVNIGQLHVVTVFQREGSMHVFWYREHVTFKLSFG